MGGTAICMLLFFFEDWNGWNEVKESMYDWNAKMVLQMKCDVVSRLELTEMTCSNDADAR